MEEVLTFLKENYQLIISLSILILSLISIVVKKRPKTLDDFIQVSGQVIGKVAEWVKQVEIPGHGDDKKIAVINLALKEAKKKLGRNLSETEIVSIYKQVGSQVESVLDAPSKKGESHG